MRKGFDGAAVVSVFSNQGEGGGSNVLSVGSTGYAAGQEVCEILACVKSNVNDDGSLSVAMAQGEPKIFYPTAKLAGSGVCHL